jgi:mRNA-degrading endonuclease toxin of MazEF toxin-antitoxin module
MKDPHFAVILTSNLLLMNPECPLISYVPMTSFKPDKHWDERKSDLKYPTDILIREAHYSALTMDTIIDCGQVHTCDIEYFNDCKFRLNNGDLKKVRAKVAVALGYGV